MAEAAKGINPEIITEEIILTTDVKEEGPTGGKQVRPTSRRPLG